jgi:hypothetical protein
MCSAFMTHACVLLSSSHALRALLPLQLLLSRIGDTLMLYLLLNASMFAALPNSCCLQLRCGSMSRLFASVVAYVC